MPSAAVSATMVRPERCLSIEDPQLAEHLAKRDEIGSDVLDPKTVAVARLDLNERNLLGPNVAFHAKQTTTKGSRTHTVETSATDI